MKSQRSSSTILDREYLEIRGKLLELAASFDRMERADREASTSATPAEEPRKAQLEQGLSILLDSEPNKAERIQLLFSREYVSTWREDYQL